MAQGMWRGWFSNRRTHHRLAHGALHRLNLQMMAASQVRPHFFVRGSCDKLPLGKTYCQIQSRAA